MQKLRKLIDLFLTFFKIGLFTFGGGYAMISIIESDCVEKKKWLTHDEMMNVTVIAESTPGPIAINCATFVGYNQGGLLGSVFATVGMVLPSFLVISLVATVLDEVLAVPLVEKAFRGIQCAVGILILDAAVKMFVKMKKTAGALFFSIVSAAVMLAVDFLSWDFSSITLLLISAGVSLLLFFALRRKGGETA